MADRAGGDAAMPERATCADDLEVLLQFVASGVAAAVMPRLAMTRLPEGVTVHPLEGQERQVIALTRESSQQRPAIALVLDALATAGTERPLPSDGRAEATRG